MVGDVDVLGWMEVDMWVLCMLVEWFYVEGGWLLMLGCLVLLCGCLDEVEFLLCVVVVGY